MADGNGKHRAKSLSRKQAVLGRGAELYADSYCRRRAALQKTGINIAKELQQGERLVIETLDRNNIYTIEARAGGEIYVFDEAIHDKPRLAIVIGSSAERRGVPQPNFIARRRYLHVMYENDELQTSSRIKRVELSPKNR